MPDFSNLTEDAVVAITTYLVSAEEKEVITADSSNAASNLKYTIEGYNKLLDVDGYPGIQPPWGTLNAIDLNRGKIRWSIPLGEVPELADKRVPATGTENYGGPVVTAGGLLFIGATAQDKKIRAFDKTTGHLLWSTSLPGAGNATPAIYSMNGREYVVIAAGGGKWGQPSCAVSIATLHRAGVTVHSGSAPEV